jgi:tetratricopeptide (TPR) repeat protein
MKVDDVLALLKETRVEEALKAADGVQDRRLMASKLTEFAGTLHHLKGKPWLTEVLLKKSLLLDWDNPVTHYNIGVLYSEPDHAEEKDGLKKAETAYRNALKLRPDFQEARYNLALLLYFTGRRGEAEAEYGRIVVAIGDDELYRPLGMLLAGKG